MQVCVHYLSLILIFIHSFVHIFNFHSFIHSRIHALLSVFIHLYFHFHLLVNSFIHSFIYSIFIHVLINFFVQSFVDIFIDWLISGKHISILSTYGRYTRVLAQWYHPNHHPLNICPHYAKLSEVRHQKILWFKSIFNTSGLNQYSILLV